MCLYTLTVCIICARYGYRLDVFVYLSHRWGPPGPGARQDQGPARIRDPPGPGTRSTRDPPSPGTLQDQGSSRLPQECYWMIDSHSLPVALIVLWLPSYSEKDSLSLSFSPTCFTSTCLSQPPVPFTFIPDLPHTSSFCVVVSIRFKWRQR